MARLSLSMLGTFQATLDGEPVTTFESDKVRALMAYLAVEAEQPHRREKLAGLLWPELSERSARQNLSQALYNLRRAIGDRDATPPFLIVNPQTLQFNRSSDHCLDVAVFKELLADCEEHRHRRLAGCDVCMDQLQQAVGLCQGGFLEGISLGDSPAFEEWSLLEGEHLQRLLMEALSHLADCLEQRGEYESALQHGWRRVELDPWQEEAHRGLMRVLALSGRRSAALAQYEHCRRTLAEELGVEPEEKTTALYQRIRDGPALPALSPVPPHNLPAQLTPFVGRERELAEAKDRLGDPDCRLLSLVGPGGIGKTRLALEAATAHLNHFTDGVYFVSLAPLQSVEAITPTVAEALNFSFYETGEPQQQLLDYLRQKSMLLILDNFEHLLEPPRPAAGDGADWVIQVLRTAPEVTILATSRARLNVQGEHLFPITGLDFPALPPGSPREDGRGEPKGAVFRQAPWPVDQPAPAAHPLWDTSPHGPEDGQDVAQYSAVRLFLTSARRVRPGFEPTADDLTEVAGICRLVHGTPLAILLAAAWIEGLTPAEIATAISRSFDFLETDIRDVPAEGCLGGERQQSMRAVFDHSWSLLTEREQEVFQVLAVFRGGFTQGAAQPVTGASLRELRALVNKSLLHRDAAGRYELHELLRAYAAEKLDQSAVDGEAARDRHCAYYAAALQGWAADMKGVRQQTALTEIEADGENARAAWIWAVEQEQVKRLERAIEGLCLFYEWRGRFQEGEAACRIAVERLAATASCEGRRVLARTLAWQSVFDNRLGHSELANQLLQKSLALLEEPEFADRDIRAERAFALLQLGHILIDSDREEARRLCEQGLALYQALGDEWGTANALDALGRVAWYSGTYEEAKRLDEESLAIRQALGDRRGAADSLMSLGNTVPRQGQIEEGVRFARQSVAILRELGDRASLAGGLGELGTALAFLGKFGESHTNFEESLAIYEDLGFRAGFAAENRALSHIEIHLGWYEGARDRAQMSLTFGRDMGYQREIGLCLFVLGSVALAMEAYAEAEGLLQDSVTALQVYGHRDELARSLATLGYAARGLGKVTQAQQHLSEALRTATEIGSHMPFMWALPAIALLLADRGEKEGALEFYVLASRYPVVANSRWFEDVAGRHIADVAATLPPDVVAAAQARGLARDVQVVAAELLVKYAICGLS